MFPTGWRDRLQAAPLWVHFLYFSVAFGVLSLFFHPADEARSGAAAAAGGVFFGVVMTGVMAVRRGREDRLVGARMRTRLADALRSGEPPSDLSHDRALLGLMQKRRQELDRAAKTRPWIYGGFLVLSLLFAFDQPVWLALGAFFLLGLVIGPRTTRRSQEKLHELERVIRGRTEAGPLLDS